MTPRRVVFGASSPKYHNERTESDGVVFASSLEARRYEQLKLLLHAGQIKDLDLQQTFTLMVNGEKVCSYRADFVYQEFSKGKWSRVVEDVKGQPTAVYKLKKKLMHACLGIDIREVK